MLLYKNGRFYSEKVSFLLPDGFYFEEDPEINCEHGFCAWSPGKDYLCSWNFYGDCYGTSAELESWLSPECGFTALVPVTPIALNGLSGHFLLYQNKQAQYYEARFDLGEGEELSFLAETRGKDLLGIVSSEEFKAALNGIQAE